MNIKEKRVKRKKGIKDNIFFIALPFTILISVLTIIGLFGGFALGNKLGGSIVGFSFSFLFSSLGFFFGVLITYLLVKRKYFVDGL